MSTAEISRLLTDLDPADLRQRIAELDRERSALAVLLRAATARQLGRERRPGRGDSPGGKGVSRAH
jgi:hypothetical protein